MMNSKYGDVVSHVICDRDLESGVSRVTSQMTGWDFPLLIFSIDVFTIIP